MESERKQEHDESCKRYLKSVSYAYILKRGGSFYEPRTDSAEHDRERYPAGSLRKRPFWVNVVPDCVAKSALLVSICTLILLFVTVCYARNQWLEAQRTAKASEDAAKVAAEASATAKNSLDLARQEFLSAEAAALQPVITVRSGNPVAFVQVDILNVGHRAATQFEGVLTFSRLAHADKVIRLTGATITDRAASPTYPSGFISRTFLLEGPLEMKSLAEQYPRVTSRFHYWNGIGETNQNFSQCLVISPYNESPEWQDCENQKAFQQPIR